MNSPDSLMKNGSNKQFECHHENRYSYLQKRTRASAEQLTVLENTFSVNVSPNSKLRKQLAQQLHMNERSIQIWFQNRRAKVKHMQKKAQIQKQQAAICAQLHHYHQQHYEIMSQYGFVPPINTMEQQPLYFPPPYVPRMPLPRAQSVDAVSYYEIESSTNMTRTPFPSLIPELCISENIAPPNPLLSHQSYFVSANERWSDSPQNHPAFDSPSDISRRSVPPYGLFTHTLVNSITIPSDQTAFNSFVDIPKQTLNLEEDFPDYIHGQTSQTASPVKENSGSNNFSSVATENIQTSSGNMGEAHCSKDLSDIPNEAQCNKRIVKDDGAARTSGTNIWVSSSLNDTEKHSQSLSNNNAFIVDENPISSPTSCILSNTDVSPSNLIMNEVPILDKELQDCQYFNTTTLTIGTWHRIKLFASDLVCVYRSTESSFTWFITEGGCRFKVKISIANLRSIEHISAVGNNDNDEPVSEIHFYMSHPPLFYMESTDENEESRWIQCSDFTENKQASRYFRHTLKGDAYQLKRALANLVNVYDDLKKIVQYLENSDQQQHYPNTIASNSSFLPLQQQHSTPIPSTPYYPHYCFNYGAPPTFGPIPQSTSFHKHDAFTNHSFSLPVTTNEAACSGLYA